MACRCWTGPSSTCRPPGFATAYITLLGSWALQQEDENENFRQNYGISYTPGGKLRICASYQEYSTADVIGTASSNVHVWLPVQPASQPVC